MSNRTLGFLLLGIWLILAGALPLSGFSFPRADLVLEVLMIVAGVLIVLGTRGSARGWTS
jgi:hypothetical protein